jgi:hypothetical protein
MQVSARVTVTPGNLKLRQTLDQFLDAGFHSVGFSPMLSAPTGKGEMQTGDLEVMLGEMIDCGREFERRSMAGQRYHFANMVNAMREIERGTHRPYPCGAGAGYLGVSADGDLAACHRFVGDNEGAMGSLAAGVDRQQRSTAGERHVHRQNRSRVLGAYSCGGAVTTRSSGAATARDYIRGWLTTAWRPISPLDRRGLSSRASPCGNQRTNRLFPLKTSADLNCLCSLFCSCSIEIKRKSKAKERKREQLRLGIAPADDFATEEYLRGSEPRWDPQE